MPDALTADDHAFNAAIDAVLALLEARRAAIGACRDLAADERTALLIPLTSWRSEISHLRRRTDAMRAAEAEQATRRAT